MMSSTNSEEETHFNSSWSSNTPPSPFSHTNSRSITRTMEEVWKDINLASLSNSNNTPNFRHMTLQDFLARPFANVVPPTSDHRHRHVTLGSPHPHQPPANDVLNLNHPDQLQLFCIENLDSTTSRAFVNLNQTNSTNNNNNTSNVSAENSFSGGYPFEGIASHSSPSSGLVLSPGFNLGRNNDGGFGGGGGDRKLKRMIKNRESAARSRARKQAYTSEMEITVNHLMKENARLRRLNEQLTNAAAAATQLPKKHTLNRSSSAPF